MNLEDLIFKAGDAEEPPPPPENGIPAQRLSGFFRWPIRALFLPFVILDTFAQKIARILVPPPYKMAGQCLKRGNCCHYIMVRKCTGLLGFLFHFWHTEVNGFFLRSEEVFEYEKHKVQVMGCRYLQKDGSCKHYAWRPMLCRKWPVIEHFGEPRMLKGCGFYAVLKNQKKEKSKELLNILK
ncbi:MAG TPA: hypothetical protein VLF61_01880 [Rhabdochlamydiaceae bacterium]|nr:hypothetical protein [Rhabdochlamydiaceae bacterium]